jgi:hypothetical protein
MVRVGVVLVLCLTILTHHAGSGAGSASTGDATTFTNVIALRLRGFVRLESRRQQAEAVPPADPLARASVVDADFTVFNSGSTDRTLSAA